MTALLGEAGSFTPGYECNPPVQRQAILATAYRDTALLRPPLN